MYARVDDNDVVVEATETGTNVAKKIEATVKEALAASDRTHVHNTRLNLSRNSLVRSFARVCVDSTLLAGD